MFSRFDYAWISLVTLGLLIFLAAAILGPHKKVEAPFFVEEEPVYHEIVRDEYPEFTGSCFLSKKQLDVVRFSFEYGLEYDLGYSLAAIALQESNAGLWNINISDPSAGYYHVTLDKVLNIYGWQDNGFNRNRAAQLLIDVPPLAARLAVRELQFWYSYTRGSWLDTWASYNAGTRGRSVAAGRQYAEDIRYLIGKIQECGWVVDLTEINS